MLQRGGLRPSNVKERVWQVTMRLRQAVKKARSANDESRSTCIVPDLNFYARFRLVRRKRETVGQNEPSSDARRVRTEQQLCVDARRGDFRGWLCRVARRSAVKRVDDGSKVDCEPEKASAARVTSQREAYCGD